MPNRTIIQHGSLVQSHAATMHTARERQFLGMEVIPTRTIQHLMGLVAQHDLNAVRGIENRGIAR
jgi:hypothetical protein